MVKLTARSVAGIKEPGRYGDGHGLMLNVKPSGTKSWVQRLVIRGVRRDMGLGSADLVSLAEARAMALENRKIARAGGDPRQKSNPQSIPTFADAARSVHTEHLPTWKNPKHGDQFINTLTTYAFPVLEKMRIDEIQSGDVLACLSPIWTTKHETARRVRQRIGTVMKWSVAKGFRADNPADNVDKGLPKVKAKVTPRKAPPYTDVGAILQSVDATGARPPTKLAFRMLVLCASRSGEVRGATWAEIDLKARTWTIPAERMKMDRSHVVPLSEAALAVLDDAKTLSRGDDLIFPGAKAGGAMSDMTMLKLLRSVAPDIDVHGFRSAFRTWAAERTTFPREVAEHALAHQVGDNVERAYQRSSLLEQRRGLMEAWSAYVMEAPGQVIELHGTASS